MAAQQKIEFTGVKLKKFSRDQNGGEAQFTANLTQRVSQQLGWGDMRDFEKSIDLEGDLSAQTMTLCAKDSLLAGYEIGVDIGGVASFKGLRREVEGRKNKGFRFDLHFKVKFVDPRACAFLEEYMCKTGDSRGTLTVSYTAQAVQQVLPGGGEASDQAAFQ